MLFWKAPQTPPWPIRFIRPSDSLLQLESSLNNLHAKRPFSTVIDITGGNLSTRLNLSQNPPTINDVSISRIRQADKPGLPTTGHLLTHNEEELRGVLKHTDTSRVLILDDTSFSGTTSIILEQMLRQALPKRTMQFTHGFLILNEGILGKNLGAKLRLNQLGSWAVGGSSMRTPRDDGWHFFDMVEHANFDAHINATMELLHAPEQEQAIVDLQRLFPNMLTNNELVRAQKTGHFVTNTQINGELHVRNPQLMPDIVKQGHLLHPRDWRAGEIATIGHLKTMHEILKGETDA